MEDARDLHAVGLGGIRDRIRIRAVARGRAVDGPGDDDDTLRGRLRIGLLRSGARHPSERRGAEQDRDQHRDDDDQALEFPSADSVPTSGGTVTGAQLVGHVRATVVGAPSTDHARMVTAPRPGMSQRLARPASRTRE